MAARKSAPKKTAKSNTSKEELLEYYREMLSDPSIRRKVGPSCMVWA